MPTYIVISEHTLGYLLPPTETNPFQYVGILRASVLRGSPYDPMSGPIAYPTTHDVRPATEKDFHDFMVAVPQDAFTGVA